MVLANLKLFSTLNIRTNFILNFNCIFYLAPSAPLELTGTSISFSTISLTWTAPSTPNGLIRDYQITYFRTVNSSDVTVVNTSSSALEFNLTGLRAFTNYSISISAITIRIGESSNLVVVRTNESSKFTFFHSVFDMLT